MERYLVATIQVPVKVSADGELTILNEYSKIEVDEADEDVSKLEKTGETIYDKVIEYVAQLPQKHTFEYIKKSKKPLNTTFHNKVAAKHSQKFTKKNYCQ